MKCLKAECLDDGIEKTGDKNYPFGLVVHVAMLQNLFPDSNLMGFPVRDKWDSWHLTGEKILSNSFNLFTSLTKEQVLVFPHLKFPVIFNIFI